MDNNNKRKRLPEGKLTPSKSLKTHHDDNDAELRTCSICFVEEEGESHPSLVKHKQCNNVTHKSCLLQWITSSINNNNAHALNCSKCRRYLTPGMILAAVGGDFDEVMNLLHNYRTNLDLTDNQYREVLREIGYNNNTQDRIISYNPPNEDEAEDEDYNVIISLNDNNSELSQQLNEDLQNIFINQTVSENDYYNDIAPYYRNIIRQLTHEEQRIVQNIFINKVIDFIRNNNINMFMNVSVNIHRLVTPSVIDYDMPDEYVYVGTVNFTERINLDTELKAFFEQKVFENLRKKGYGRITNIDVMDAFAGRGAAHHPFPVVITLTQYLRMRLTQCNFPIGYCYKELTNTFNIKIDIKDNVVLPPRSNTNTERPSAKNCNNNSCSIMGGKIRKTYKRGRKQQKRKTKHHK